MSEEPFGLPDWTFVLAVVLLSIGFIIAVILSWIYDIHPEEGIVKTESAEKEIAEDVVTSSSRWKIATYISLVVIAAMIIVIIIKPFSNTRSSKELTILVLPFHNDSPGEGDYYTF